METKGDLVQGIKKERAVGGPNGTRGEHNGRLSELCNQPVENNPFPLKNSVEISLQPAAHVLVKKKKNSLNGLQPRVSHPTLELLEQSRNKIHMTCLGVKDVK